MIQVDRVFLIVADSLGIGALPDADRWGDAGSNTLASIARSPAFRADTLRRLGLFGIDSVTCGNPEKAPAGVFARMTEQSMGKDTTTGHWEIAGVISPAPLPTYPDGFPEEVLAPFRARTGRGVLCNRPYSGTQVIKDYGQRHLDTGDLILYTSADSVFQVAAHEALVPPEELYEICRTARALLAGKHNVGRVIARPFAGPAPDFFRTENRRDFSLSPPRETLLDLMKDAGMDVLAVGKIHDIFAGSGITQSFHTHNNSEGMDCTRQLLNEAFHGLCFVNLVDFDMLYGHRNDVDGYAAAIAEFDRWLGREFLPALRPGDLVLITGDHGCDPAAPGTDHSREYTPLLAFSPGIGPKNLGTRASFADIGKTIAALFRLENRLDGDSFEGALGKC